MSDLIERLRDPKTEGACWCCQSAADEIERLTTENSDLKAFREAVVGWREYDWVEGFCRKTAEHVAKNAKCVQRTYRNEPVSSSQKS